ncbi:MAG TPA: PQQ-binding-like beta-propeller repeat protein [Puia sp.]|nr:PQQ-binding-like beta-propeller repeat protein [Puia sp.]
MSIRLLLCAGIFLLLSSLIHKENKRTNLHRFTSAADTVSPSGKKVFDTHCQTCHKDSGIALAPDITILSAMTPKAIFAALNNGKMRVQGALLNEADRKAVSEWLSQNEIKTTGFPEDAFAPFSIAPNKFDYSGWGGNKEGTGYRTTEQAGISTANLSSLRLKWAFAFPDATVIRSKPACVGDWIIVGGQFGELMAIHKNSGKIGWVFNANAAIRGAIAITENAGVITAFFADFSTNVYAVDVKTGKLIWNKRAGFDQQSSVTGSVAVSNGKVYVPISSIEVAMAADGNYSCCTSSGGVVALDAASGRELWRHRVLMPAAHSGTKKNGKPFYGPSGAPVWCSPTVDVKRSLLYIGTGENYSMPSTNTSDAVQALDLKTGKLIWNFQSTSNDIYNLACPLFNNCPGKAGPDLDFGMAPILIKKAGGNDILVAGQKSGMVYALSPASGRIIWKTRIGKGGALGGIHWGMATDGQYLYAANADNILALDKRDTSLKASPGLYALDVMTGKIIWKTASPACTGNQNCIAGNSAAPAMVPGIVFAGGLDGHMRAYSTRDGKIIWDFDTNKEYETTNGIKGKGGAIDGPAPAVSGGMLFVNSGYGMFGQRPGNVLLCFETDRKK